MGCFVTVLSTYLVLCTFDLFQVSALAREAKELQGVRAKKDEKPTEGEILENQKGFWLKLVHFYFSIIYKYYWELWLKYVKIISRFSTRENLQTLLILIIQGPCLPALSMGGTLAPLVWTEWRRITMTTPSVSRIQTSHSMSQKLPSQMPLPRPVIKKPSHQSSLVSLGRLRNLPTES